MKLGQKGIAHHLLLVGLAVIVVGAAGFAGWRVYSAKKLDAQAQSGVIRADNGTFKGLTFSGCIDAKRYIKISVKRTDNYYKSTYISVYSGGKTSNKSGAWIPTPFTNISHAYYSIYAPEGSDFGLYYATSNSSGTYTSLVKSSSLGRC